MQNFEYVNAQSVDEVISLLSSAAVPVRILSGGTDLIVQLREGRKQAGMVVDIKRIPQACELSYDPARGLTIGSAVSCQRICSDSLISSAYPGLVDAFSLIGGTQIQGRATVGGNLCNASPAADAVPALIAHKALAVIAGPQGTRELPVEEFCTAPGQNVLQQGEFLLTMRVPPIVPGSGAAYLRFIPRNEMDIAVVGVGVWVALDETRQRYTGARIALGAVAPTPLFVPEAGDFLVGREVSDETILEAARIAQAAARPITDMRGTVNQRRHLSMILTRRALNIATERARGLRRAGSNGHNNPNGSGADHS